MTFAGAEGPAEPLDPDRPRRVQHALQLDVERAGAQAAAVHRAQHLDVAHRVELEARRHAGADHGPQLARRILGLDGVDEEEVRALRCGQLRHGALVDAVRVGDDPARGRLAEHLRQPDHRDGARADHVGQHLARPHARQLVHVAHQQQRRVVGQCLQQGAHQRHIDHAALVHHQQAAVERVRLAAALVHFDDLRGGRMLFLLWFEHPDVPQAQRRSPSPHPEDVVQGAELAGL